MHVSKFFVPMMLALTGLAQVAPVTDERALEGQAYDAQSAGENAVFLETRDVDDIDVELTARQDGGQDDRRRCRNDEYYDRSSRRCRRYEPLPRPNCRFGERAYCGRDRRFRVPYDRSNPECWRRDDNRAFCARDGSRNDGSRNDGSRNN